MMKKRWLTGAKSIDSLRVCDPLQCSRTWLRNSRLHWHFCSGRKLRSASIFRLCLHLVTVTIYVFITVFKNTNETPTQLFLLRIILYLTKLIRFTFKCNLCAQSSLQLNIHYIKTCTVIKWILNIIPKSQNPFLENPFYSSL